METRKRVALFAGVVALASGMGFGIASADYSTTDPSLSPVELPHCDGEWSNDRRPVSPEVAARVPNGNSVVIDLKDERGHSQATFELPLERSIVTGPCGDDVEVIKVRDTPEIRSYIENHRPNK